MLPVTAFGHFIRAALTADEFLWGSSEPCFRLKAGSMSKFSKCSLEAAADTKAETSARRGASGRGIATRRRCSMSSSMEGIDSCLTPKLVVCTLLDAMVAKRGRPKRERDFP